MCSIVGLSHQFTYFRVSHEENVEESHTISPDGYDVGRYERGLCKKRFDFLISRTLCTHDSGFVETT